MTMQSVNYASTYALPESRKDETQRLPPRLVFSSAHGYLKSYVSLRVEGSSVSHAPVVLLEEQVVKATQNSLNTVRGCLTSENTLETFDKAPTSYEEKLVKLVVDGPQVVFESTSLVPFVAVRLPWSSTPFVVKGDEVLAAVKNARNV